MLSFFLSVFVRFGIGATICKQWDIQCLQYAGFLVYIVYITLNGHYVKSKHVQNHIFLRILIRRKSNCILLNGAFQFSLAIKNYIFKNLIYDFCYLHTFRNYNFQYNPIVSTYMCCIVKIRFMLQINKQKIQIILYCLQKW